MEVGIVVQPDDDRAADLAARIREALAVEDVAIAQDAKSAGDSPVRSVPVCEMCGWDLVVSVGGDGTFLYTAHNVGSTPILGVNRGEVGFLNAVSPGSAVRVVREEIERIREDGAPRTRELWQVRATGDGWTLPPALNEVSVVGPKRGHGNEIDVEVRVDGSVYASGPADGVLVATPTGSTAYNLSERGPLLHHDVPGVVVTGMCARDGMPSLVVSAEATVAVRVETPGTAVAVADGHATRELAPPEEVRLTRAEQSVRMAGPSQDFYAALGKLE